MQFLLFLSLSFWWVIKYLSSLNHFTLLVGFQLMFSCLVASQHSFFENSFFNQWMPCNPYFIFLSFFLFGKRLLLQLAYERYWKMAVIGFYKKTKQTSNRKLWRFKQFLCHPMWSIDTSIYYSPSYKLQP